MSITESDMKSFVSTGSTPAHGGTMISIRFFRPDDEAAMQGNVVAEFVLSVPVEEWGGTLDGRGRVIVSYDGSKKVIWPRHNITGRYHATPQPHDSISAANSWILARCEEWQGRGK